MKIALFSSPVHTVPPNEKNILAPWELVNDLANGLVERGHNVSLFAPKGSKTKARLFDGNISPLILEKPKYSHNLDEYRAMVVAQSLGLFRYMSDILGSDAVDIAHVHQSIELFYPALPNFPKNIPLFATFHDMVDPTRWPGLEKVSSFSTMHFVGISNAQFQHTPFRSISVVPNGVDINLFAPDRDSDLNDHPLLMVGRIVPEKGFTDGMAAARASTIRLMIVGQRYDEIPRARQYFDEQIQPHIDGKRMIWEPVVKRDHLIGHYQTARALLFPIHWDEPFGLVMIEAMACGTPVIAYNRGSVPEVVRDGVTGFIVDEDDADRPGKGSWSIKKQGIDGLVEAIKRIGEIDRAVCRKHVEKNFTIDRMVDGYEKVYTSVLQSLK